MGRYGTLDYARLARVGFLLGVAMFAVGGGGELIGHAAFESLPAWEEALFLNLEIGGILVGLASPILFGVVMPLTE